MKQIIADAIAEHKKLLAALETKSVDTIIAAAEMIIKAINDNGCVYLCGNGGRLSAYSRRIRGQVPARAKTATRRGIFHQYFGDNGYRE